MYPATQLRFGLYDEQSGRKKRAMISLFRARASYNTTTVTSFRGCSCRQVLQICRRQSVSLPGRFGGMGSSRRNRSGAMPRRRQYTFQGCVPLRSDRQRQRHRALRCIRRIRDKHVPRTHYIAVRYELGPEVKPPRSSTSVWIWDFRVAAFCVRLQPTNIRTICLFLHLRTRYGP